MLKLTKLVAVLSLAASSVVSAFTIDINKANGPITGLWWNANESGWGQTMTQQYDLIFTTIFTYAADKTPTWYIGTCTVVGDSCTAKLYKTTGGNPVTKTWVKDSVTLTDAGTMEMKFTSNDVGVAKYTIGADVLSKSLTREIFSLGPTQPVQPSGWREAFVARVNGIRATGVTCGTAKMTATTPVVWDNALELAATNHSLDMALNNFFSHTGSNGSTFYEREAAAGFNGWPSGENIAAGVTTEEGAFTLWLGSSGHCQNMMSPYINAIGLGAGYNADSDWRYYWTLNTGTK